MKTRFTSTCTLEQGQSDYQSFLPRTRCRQVCARGSASYGGSWIWLRGHKRSLARGQRDIRRAYAHGEEIGRIEKMCAALLPNALLSKPSTVTSKPFKSSIELPSSLQRKMQKARVDLHLVHSNHEQLFFDVVQRRHLACALGRRARRRSRPEVKSKLSSKLGLHIEFSIGNKNSSHQEEAEAVTKDGEIGPVPLRLHW